MRTPLLTALVGLALTLSACQDPSGVGLELIGEEGTNPNVAVVAADAVATQEEEDVTGGFTNASPAQVRFLVGAVMDPLGGDALAEGFFDFVPSTTVPQDFFDDPILGAELRLDRDYLYGDSTAMLPLEFYQIDETWTPSGAASDTTFAVGDLLGSETYLASDTLFTFELPSSWVDQYDEILRSDSVVTAIEGFQVRVPAGAMPGVVVGINGRQSVLRLRTAQDTVNFPLSEIFSRIERGASTASLDGVALLRDGSGEVLTLTFPVDTLGTRALANATLRLAVDAEVLDTGDGFARPLPEALALFFRDEDGTRVLITTAERDDDDRFTFVSSGLTGLLQRQLLDPTTIQQFELAFLPSPSTLDVVPLIVGPEPAPGDPDRRPRFALTLVPVTN